ncbi:35228_t:CDS:2 [Gigaspora margarita]|uniref:35228_t:CDS:1 n=1 Tax=Gigaspora margarita TaxID=4874 RepID=A0ABN7UUF6_GIGMA|nr:35228_t:CDS:2 [Gigaspora margarita]
MDIVCYESNSKGKSQLGERSSNRVLQEKSNISPWMKYAKEEIKLELEPDYFINKSKESSISLENVRSLQDKKEKIRVVIKEPSLELIDRIAWAKKEEEILDSIKEDLKQKEKIDLGPNRLREVFIPRDKKEYRNRHIGSRGFLADDIGLALERINLSKNKTLDMTMTFLNKLLTFF